MPPLESVRRWCGAGRSEPEQGLGEAYPDEKITKMKNGRTHLAHKADSSTVRPGIRPTSPPGARGRRRQCEWSPPAALNERYRAGLLAGLRHVLLASLALLIGVERQVPQGRHRIALTRRRDGDVLRERVKIGRASCRDRGSM